MATLSLGKPFRLVNINRDYLGFENPRLGWMISFGDGEMRGFGRSVGRRGGRQCGGGVLG